MFQILQRAAGRGALVAMVSTGLAFTAASARAEVKLQGAGATFPAPIYKRWVSEYEKVKPEVKIDYQSIGSGGGIKAITEKTVDFGASDAPLSKKELQAAGGNLVHIPTVAGAVVPAYNIPGFQGELKLDGATLADIYLGSIHNWNDPRIAALNPGVSLPGLAITPAYRTDGSGTTYVFTNYLITQSDAFRNKIGAGKQVQWPAGAGGKGNEGVTEVVQSVKGALGYIELNYAIENKIPFAAMKNKDGKFVKASLESVAAAGEGAVKQMGESLAVNILNQPGERAYPISSFTYILVYKDLVNIKDEQKAKVLVEFLRWATHEPGGKIASELYYAPLSEGVQKKVDAALATLTFAGRPVAVAR